MTIRYGCLDLGSFPPEQWTAIMFDVAPMWIHRFRTRRSTTSTSTRSPRLRSRGQATVEFAFAGILALTLIFGTIDFGRAIYIKSTLTNAVREGARYGQIHPADTSGIKRAVVDVSPGLGLRTSSVSVACVDTCTPGERIIIRASLDFSAVTQQFLGVRPIRLTSSASVTIE